MIHANDADDVTGSPAPFFDCVALANSDAEIPIAKFLFPTALSLAGSVLIISILQPAV